MSSTSLEYRDLGPHAHQRAPLGMPPGKEGITTRTLSPKPEVRQKREGSEEAKSSRLEVYFEVKVNKILVDRIGSLVRIRECSNLTAKFWT